MKLNKLSQNLLAITLLIGATANTVSASTIEGAVSDHIALGTGYNSQTGEFLNVQAVKGIIGVKGNTETKIRHQTNINYQKTASLLSGNVTANGDFPVITADAYADVALQSASDSYSSNWVLNVVNSAKSLLND